MQTALTIAGFDPSSGAGITADLMVFAAHSLFGVSAITALTVQSTVGVRAVHPTPPETLRETLACLDDDLPTAGIKIGMLASAENVAMVCDYLDAVGRRSPRIPVVLDPVLRSTSGRELLDAEGVQLVRERLLPSVDWVTPNLAELAVLTGKSVVSREDLEPAARYLQQMPGSSDGQLQLGVFATGGHLDPPDDLLLTPAGEITWLPGTRIETRATHGTGCALSSAFLSRLVHGDPPAEAARAAKGYVEGALRAAIPRGRGRGPLAPLYTWVKL